MQKNNKAFVKSIIIASSVALCVLMIIMFAGIKYYISQKSNGSTSSNNTREEIATSTPQVEYTSTLLVMVKEIDEDHIFAYDIENNIGIDKTLNIATTINDAYGGAIPLESIHKGDIVEITYSDEQEKVISISKTTRSWTKTNVSGAIVSDDIKQLKIDGTVYNYNSNILVLRDGSVESNMSFIGAYDVLDIQGIDNTIWSISIKKVAATLELTDLPTKDGQLEIDIKTVIQLSDITGPISITPGTHKILVSMKGYETVIENVEIGQGEAYEYSLKDTPKAYTQIIPAVSAGDKIYTVKLAGNTYKKGDQIKVQQGDYDVVIAAEGYYTWTGKISCTKPTYSLRVNLKEIPTETEAPEESTAEEAEVSAAKESYTINISTDPTGAKVYLDGVYKGTTPYKVTLPVGDYSVLLEKDGYEIYTTSIIIDGSDEQNSFLYVLTPSA